MWRFNFVDSRVVHGTVFVPTSSSSVESGVGEPATFFPFRPRGTQAAEIIAKPAVMRLSFTDPPARDEDTPTGAERSAVVIECANQPAPSSASTRAASCT